MPTCETLWTIAFRNALIFCAGPSCKENESPPPRWIIEKCSERHHKRSLQWVRHYAIESQSVSEVSVLFGIRRFQCPRRQIFVKLPARLHVALRVLKQAFGFLRLALGQHLESILEG